MSMRWPAARIFMAFLMKSRGGTFCRTAFTVVSTIVGSLRPPWASFASAVMRRATISAFGPTRS